MTTTSLKIDYAAIYKKFEDHIDSDYRIKTAVDNFAKKIFVRAKEAMLKEFNQNKITEELRNGPTSENISNTLNGYGNLFSFLGFFPDDKPTEELYGLLEKVNYARTVKRKNIVYFKINLPDKREIDSATPLNWGSGTGWAYAIENGLFGGDAELSRFVFKQWAGSRSGGGFQIKADYVDEDFQPQMYITEILAHFKDRINGVKVL